MNASHQLLNFSKRRRMPEVLQTQMSECGLACIAMILGYHGNRIDLHTMRGRIQLSSKGIDLDGLVKTAAMFGLTGRPLALELDELSQLQLPCVLHWDMNHFVVLSEVSSRGATIFDPARGRRELLFNELGNHFTGVALELTPHQTLKPKTNGPG